MESKLAVKSLDAFIGSIKDDKTMVFEAIKSFFLHPADFLIYTWKNSPIKGEKDLISVASAFLERYHLSLWSIFAIVVTLFL